MAAEVDSETLQQLLLAQVLLGRHERRLESVVRLRASVVHRHVLRNIVDTALVAWRLRLAELDGDRVDREGGLRLWRSDQLTQ